MLQAMNTGHDGSLSTGHGNSAHDMLIRLETMVLMAANLPLAAVRSQIVSALDLVMVSCRAYAGVRAERYWKFRRCRELMEGEIRLAPIYQFGRMLFRKIMVLWKGGFGRSGDQAQGKVLCPGNCSVITRSMRCL